MRHVIPEPIVIEAHVGDAAIAFTRVFTGVNTDSTRRSKSEHSLPHRRQEDGVPGLAHVLLRNLKLDRLIGFLKRSK